MIPKVIHYCWFGEKPMTKLALRCIESWMKKCPNYEIRRWDETNFDLDRCMYTKEAYEEKEWAFVSDYARLRIIYDHGGIYLDTDVELIKPLDDLLDKGCFLGTETSGYIATGLGFGAERGNWAVRSLLSEYSGCHFRGKQGVLDRTPCPHRNTLPFYRLGYRYSTVDIWNKDNVYIYPPEYFCPMDHETKKVNITAHSYSIHHFAASWVTKEDMEIASILQDISNNEPRMIAAVKKQIVLYKGQRKIGNTKCFFTYIWAKLMLKIKNR